MVEEEKNLEKISASEPKPKNGVHFFIISLFVITILVFLSIIIVSESKKFEYVGLTFEKQKFGEIPIFSSSITGYSVNREPIDYRVNLRNDPRYNNVSVQKNIMVVPGMPVYVSLNMSSNISDCGPLALISLGQFMRGLGYETITGITTKDKADEFNKLHVTCDNNTGSTVLIVSEGNETSITVDKKNSDCYHITVNDCKANPEELTKAIERAEMSILSEMTNKPL